MKSTLLSLLSASGVAAQITFAPPALKVAAIAFDDPDYTTCSVAAEYLSQCVADIGGAEALYTAQPSDLVGCACCDGATAVSPLFRACSTYLSEEAPLYTAEYSAYGELYRVCSRQGACSASSPATLTRDGSDSSGSSRVRGNGNGKEAASMTISSSATQTYAPACISMLDIFASCTRENRGFTTLPFAEQASCYCCRKNDNAITWTDEMDKYAQTCSKWALTAEPKTALSVAKTWAHFCERFSNVCDATGTATADASDVTATDGSANGSGNTNTDPVTVTVAPPTATATSAGGSDSGSAATSVRVGSSVMFGAVAAVAALAFAL